MTSIRLKRADSIVQEINSKKTEFSIKNEVESNDDDSLLRIN